MCHTNMAQGGVRFAPPIQHGTIDCTTTPCVTQTWHKVVSGLLHPFSQAPRSHKHGTIDPPPKLHTWSRAWGPAEAGPKARAGAQPTPHWPRRSAATLPWASGRGGCGGCGGEHNGSATGAQWGPTGANRVTTGAQRGSTGAQREHNGGQREHNGGQREHNGSTTWANGTAPTGRTAVH